MTVPEIASIYHISATTVQTVRTSYATKGLEATLYRKKRETPPVPPKVTGEIEAHIVPLACSELPDGYSKWSLRLLADKCLKLNYIKKSSKKCIKDKEFIFLYRKECYARTRI